jgi:hypothetical protein
MWLGRHHTIYYQGQGVPLLASIDHSTKLNWNETYNSRIELYKNNYVMEEWWLKIPLALSIRHFKNF